MDNRLESGSSSVALKVFKFEANDNNGSNLVDILNFHGLIEAKFGKVLHTVCSKLESKAQARILKYVRVLLKLEFLQYFSQSIFLKRSSPSLILKAFKDNFGNVITPCAFSHLHVH